MEMEISLYGHPTVRSVFVEAPIDADQLATFDVGYEFKVKVTGRKIETVIR